MIAVPPPPAALSASPARIELAGRASAVILVRNPGNRVARVDAAPAGFALDLRGTPRIVVGRDPRVAIAVRPRTVELRPGGSASLLVTSRIREGARPGDHPALVLLATRPAVRAGVGVRLRVGVIVIVRVAGVLRRRIGLQAPRLERRGRRWVLAVLLRNSGNVVERVGTGTLRLVLRRRGRVAARLPAARRELLPGARAVVLFGVPPGVRGAVRAVVELRPDASRPTRRASRLLRLP